MERSPSTVRAVVVACLTLVALSVGPPTVAAQATAVDDCTTIDESGAYELNESIQVENESALRGDAPDAENASAGDDPATANQSTPTDSPANVSGPAASDACIVISADDVVLRGNDNVLSGPVDPTANETVERVTETAGPVDGTNASSDVTRVAGVAVRPGPGADEVSNVTIRNLTVEHWYVGVTVTNATNVSLRNLSMANNTVAGVSFGGLPARPVGPQVPESDLP